MEEKDYTKYLVSANISFAIKINTVRQKHYNLRKGSKSNFNFFSGLVNGKTKKTHIEKYHSNFISYLLNPQESHDCDSIFLKSFIQFLKDKCKSRSGFDIWSPSEVELSSVVLERERPAYDRIIDIVIESKVEKEWIIFIENKFWHFEGINQFKDYHEYSKLYKRRLGIYLTLDGSPPNSIKNENIPENEIINLSYSELIDWLFGCCSHKDIMFYPHIISALKQYIDVIKYELKIMENKEMEDIIEYLEENSDKALLLVQERAEINRAIEKYIEIKRKIYLLELRSHVKDEIINSHIQFVSVLDTDDSESYIQLQYQKHQLHLWLDQSYPIYDEGGQGLWWGIYDSNKKPFPFKFDLEKEGYWEGIVLNDINDFEDADKGSAIIIAAIADKKFKDESFKKVSSYIIDSLKVNVFPVLDAIK